WSSETLQFRMRKLTRVDMHGAELGTTVQGRNVLAGIQKVVGIPGGFEGVKELQLIAIELCAHLVDLLATHTMFAGNRAPNFHAMFQYASANCFSSFELAWRVGIEQNQGVQVAIASMKYVCDTQFVLFGKLLDTGEHMRQGMSGYGAIHAVVVRGD